MDYKINSRILELRKNLKMSQTEFGKGIGVSRGVINNIDLNIVDITTKPLLIQQICKEFNVNRVWLETGEGEMFAQLSEDEELAMIFGEVLSGEMDPRRIKLIKSIMNIVKNIPDESLPIVGDYARQLADALEEKKEDEA